VIATADPAGSVWRGEQRVDFAVGQVGDDDAVEAFRRDGQHALDGLAVFGMPQRGLSAVDDYPQWTGRRIRIPLQGRRLAL